MTLKNNKPSAFSLIELSIVILIIGVLIAAVITGSRVYYKSKLITARTLTHSSPVSGIKDLVLWVDSTSSNSFDSSEIDNGTSISNWHDINPQETLVKNKFTQSNSAAKPTYQESSLNGLPSLYFNGSSSAMSTSAISSDNLFKTGDFTFFIVTKFPNSILQTAVLFQFSEEEGGGSRNLGLEFNDTLGQIRLDSSNTSIYSSASTIPFEKTLVLTGTRDSATTKLYYNGSQIASGESSTYLTFNGKFYLGSYIESEHFTKANIGEVIVYGRSLTSEEKSAVEKYLIQKWGIEVNYTATEEIY